MDTIFFATSNRGKFQEAQKALSEQGVQIEHFPFSHNELRSESLEEIASEAAEEAYRRCQRPVFVEDSGLFVKALGGFPGTYSAWVMKKIGPGGILKLLDGAKDRSAYFEACIAYHDGEKVGIFKGRCDGSISLSQRGRDGFGYDPIFIPEGHDKTFAESIDLKNKISHRYISLLEFSRNLKHR